MRRNSLLLLAAAAMAVAQPSNQTTNQTQPPPASQKPASLSGEVRNSMSGLPIERAHVLLRIYQNNGWDRYGALTDAEGKFTILGIPAGTYSLAMDRTGFVVPSSAPTTNVVLTPDQKKDNVKLKLIPVGAILGRVVDGEGAPMEGISVQAIQGGRAHQSGATDDRGQYRIGGLTPGKYRIKAMVPLLLMPPEIRTDGTVEIHYAATFYPGDVEEKAARRVEVGPASDVTGVDIRMVQTPILRVSGRVAGLPEGSKGGMVQVRQGQNVATATQAKPDGTFELWRLDPGKYTLQAMYNGGDDAMNSASVDLELGQSDVENVELRLTLPEDIHGQIAFDDEMAKRPMQSQNPAQSAQGQSAQSSQSQLQNIPTRVLLRDADRGYVSKQETVADDGSFTLTKLQPGKYVVMVQGYRAYVKSVTMGKTDSGGPELDLSSGSNGAAVTVTLASTYGTVTGVVSDDKGPAAGARLLVKDAQNRDISRGARSGQDGSFKIAQLPPGKYRMAVMDDNDNSAALSSDPAMEDFDEAFEVGPNETVTRDMKLHPVTGKQ